MVEPGSVISPRGRILIADDEESVLLSTSELLRRRGFSCDCAKDAAEAAHFLGAGTYDLLLSDIRMPGNQDLDLIRKVPQLNAGLPVILMTGYPSTSTALQAIQLPVFAYMVKPIDFDELLQNVERSVSFRRVTTTLLMASDRLQTWTDGVKEIRQQFEASPQAASQGALLGALALTLGNMSGVMQDLQSLFHLAVGLEQRDEQVCKVPNCPRLEAMENALVEGIQVLEATKGAYRSKALGALRRRFEAILPNIK